MIHVTVCTPRSQLDHPYLRAQLASAKRLGFRSVVLTHDRLWTCYFHYYKVLLLKHFLRTIRNDDEVILFTDATDVGFINNASPQTIEQRFREFHVPLLFSGEPIGSPPHLGPEYRNDPGTYIYLNSGCIIGYAGALRRIVDKMTHPLHPRWQRYCDQHSYTRFHLDHPGTLRLDTESALFQSGIHIWEVGVERERIHHRRTGTEPLLMHFNGDKRVHEHLFEPDDLFTRKLHDHLADRGFDPSHAPDLPEYHAGDPSEGASLLTVSAGPPRMWLPKRWFPELNESRIGGPDLPQILRLLWGRRLRAPRLWLENRLGPPR